jgi:hypothetical protein
MARQAEERHQLARRVEAAHVPDLSREDCPAPLNLKWDR